MMTAKEPTAECPSREDLFAFSCGAIPEERSDILLQHLDNCDDCQSELETIDGSEDSLIAGLREQVNGEDIVSEPQCGLAIAKALGALAEAHQSGPRSTLDLPQAIGEYEIVRQLGQGGMGQVFLARQTKLGREVALKVIADHRLADPNARRRFENEMQAVGRLSHPNIVTAYDAREIDSTAVLVTEYIDGLNLGQIVAAVGPLSIADACKAAEQVAVALQYTGDQGFVHRDIKPSNVMLSRTGEVKLLDLGLARLQDHDPARSEVTGTGQTMGTADYVSPEQVNDSREVDIRSDLYSLGCTLVKLLTGNPPFATRDHATAFAKLNAHVNETAPNVSMIRSDVPKSLAQLIDQLLAKDPNQRPAQPMHVAKELTKFSGSADLGGLVDRAFKASKTVVSATQDDLAEATAVPKVAVLPWWRKPVSMLVAIAAGVTGIGMGLLMGVLITIEFADGNKVVMSVPDEAKVTFESDGEGGEVDPAGSELETAKRAESKHAGAETDREDTASFRPTDAMPTSSRKAKPLFPLSGATPGPPIPLMFAVRVDDPKLAPANERTTGKIETLGSETVTVIQDQNGIWFPIHASFSSVATTTIGGQEYIQVSPLERDQLQWPDLQNQIVFVQSMLDTVAMELAEPAARKLHALTKGNLNKKLVVIIDGEIVMEPWILTELYDRVLLRGKLSAEQRSVLARVAGGMLGKSGDGKSGDGPPRRINRGDRALQMDRGMLDMSRKPPAANPSAK